jgi:hypothetical protein
VAQNGSLPAAFVLGAPGPVGGADTELWHTLRLWRKYGLEVAVVPTWGLSETWRQKCQAIGCTVYQPRGPRQLLNVPGLRGSVVVSFCNKHFLKNAAGLRGNGCKTVWVNCMTWMFDEERRHYEQQGVFDHYVFQSKYQQSRLVSELEKYGYREDQGSLSRGAFAIDEFVFRPLPHQRDEPFVVGRISRADADKYSADTWRVYGQIPYPIRARVMAWNERIQKKLGPPPDWAECLGTSAETPQEFLGKLHCLLQVNGGAAENWPRAGLEAMAAGVPLVVENQWGWREMIRHGETGYLCDSEDELGFYTARLAYDEQHRMELITRARLVLQTELANPDTIWAGWNALLERLSG